MIINKFRNNYNLHHQNKPGNYNNNNLSLKALPTFLTEADNINITSAKDSAIGQIGPLDRICMYKLIQKLQGQNTVNMDYPQYRISIISTGTTADNIINKLSYNILAESRNKKSDIPNALIANGKIIKDPLGNWYIKPELLPSNIIELSSFVNEYNRQASTQFKVNSSLLNILNTIKKDLETKKTQDKENPFAIGALERIVDEFSMLSEDVHNKALLFGNNLISYISNEYSSQINTQEINKILTEVVEASSNPIQTIKDLRKFLSQLGKNIEQ